MRKIAILLLSLCLLAPVAQAAGIAPLDAEIHAITLETPALLYFMTALPDGSFIISGTHAQEDIVFVDDTMPADTVFEAYALCVGPDGSRRWSLTRLDPARGSSSFVAMGAMADGRALLSFNPRSETSMGPALFIVSDSGEIEGELPIATLNPTIDDASLRKTSDGFHSTMCLGNGPADDLIFLDEAFAERFRLPFEGWAGWGLASAESPDAYFLVGYYTLPGESDSKISLSRPRGAAAMKVAKDGTLLWTHHSEASLDDNRQQAFSPMALADGGFAYEHRALPSEGGVLESALVGLDADGNVTFTHALPQGAYGVMHLGDGFVAIAPADTASESFGDALILTHLDTAGNETVRRLTLPEGMASTPFGVTLEDGSVILCVATTPEPPGTMRMHYPYTYRYVRLTPNMF